MVTTSSRRFGMGRVYLDATAEARRRGDRRVGTEHLLLALIADPDSSTARALDVPLSVRTLPLASFTTKSPFVCMVAVVAPGV